jgi:hypothetical protein
MAGNHDALRRDEQKSAMTANNACSMPMEV